MRPLHRILGHETRLHWYLGICRNLGIVCVVFGVYFLTHGYPVGRTLLFLLLTGVLFSLIRYARTHYLGPQRLRARAEAERIGRAAQRQIGRANHRRIGGGR